MILTYTATIKKKKKKKRSDQIRKKLRITSDLLKKFIMENFIFCAVIQSFRNVVFKF